MRSLSPYVVVLWVLTMVSFGRTLGFTFVLNISFKNGGLRLLIVLNYLIATFLVLLMFMVVLLDFLSKIL